jgi:hypothetical protein
VKVQDTLEKKWDLSFIKDILRQEGRKKASSSRRSNGSKREEEKNWLDHPLKRKIVLRGKKKKEGESKRERERVKDR